MKISRRHFLEALGLGTLSTAFVASAEATTDSLDVTRQRLVFPSLPAEFEGYTIGFLTDLHVGGCSGGSLTERAAHLLNEQKPDLVLLGGDYILRSDDPIEQISFSLARSRSCLRMEDNYSEEQLLARSHYEGITQLLSVLRPPDGVAGVLGNHDYWVSPRWCIDCFSASGIEMLVNRSRVIRRGNAVLELFGGDDYWSGRPILPRFQTSARSFRIVLTHNPDYFSEALARGRPHFDLGLAGHTHGGQIKLPLIGAPFFNVEDLRFAEGLATIDGTSYYTSRGVGTVGIPMRINCPPGGLRHNVVAGVKEYFRGSSIRLNRHFCLL